MQPQRMKERSGQYGTKLSVQPAKDSLSEDGSQGSPEATGEYMNKEGHGSTGRITEEWDT